ncbi:unnamed protein product, partial [Chrysoparadoxa australica]
MDEEQAAAAVQGFVRTWLARDRASWAEEIGKARRLIAKQELEIRLLESKVEGAKAEARQQVRRIKMEASDEKDNFLEEIQSLRADLAREKRERAAEKARLEEKMMQLNRERKKVKLIKPRGETGRQPIKALSSPKKSPAPATSPAKKEPALAPEATIPLASPSTPPPAPLITTHNERVRSSDRHSPVDEKELALLEQMAALQEQVAVSQRQVELLLRQLQVEKEQGGSSDTPVTGAVQGAETVAEAAGPADISVWESGIDRLV